MTVHRSRALLLICALIAAATPGFAQTFPVHDVAPAGDDAYHQATAVDPQGNAIVIWGLEGLGGNGLGLRAARYVAATDTWSPAVDLARSTEPRHFITSVVMDAAGNAIAVGRRHYSSGGGRLPTEIIAARYSIATGQWTPFTVLSPFTVELTSFPQVAIDAAGNAIVVWLQGTCFSCTAYSAHAARYSPSSGWTTWVLASGVTDELPPRVALDASGNAIVMFGRDTATGLSIHVMRYSTTTATWSAAQMVADTTCHVHCSLNNAMAMDSQGNALLSWVSSSDVLQAVRFNAGTGAWSSVEPISSLGDLPDIAADPDGNFVAIWQTTSDSLTPPRVQARRYVASSGTWEPIVTLADVGSNFGAEVVMDANGNATAVWKRFTEGATPAADRSAIQGARFVAAAGTWSGAINLSDPASVSMFSGAAPAVDSAGHVRITWSKYSNPYISSENGGVQSTRWPAGVTPTGPPGPPVNVSATVTGSTVALRWGGPTSGGAPTNYSLVGRTTAGGPVLATVPMGPATSFSVIAPTGTFVLSVRAENASGVGPESASVRVTVPQSGSAPGPPSNLTANVTGNSVTFTWSPPTSGGPVANYMLVAGLLPGFTVPYASIPLGATPSFSVPGVPAGTFYVRILAQNAAGTSAPSNEVAFTVAGPQLPGAPTLLAPTVSGSTVTLSWSPGPGGTPLEYTLTASMTPGGTAIAAVALTGTSVSFPGVPSGTYYLRLTASNVMGTSPPSNEVTLTVP